MIHLIDRKDKGMMQLHEEPEWSWCFCFFAHGGCGAGVVRVLHTVCVLRHRHHAPALWLRSEVLCMIRGLQESASLQF